MWFILFIKLQNTYQISFHIHSIIVLFQTNLTCKMLFRVRNVHYKQYKTVYIVRSLQYNTFYNIFVFILYAPE